VYSEVILALLAFIGGAAVPLLFFIPSYLIPGSQ
jgi:hypothetical protein